MTVYRAPLRRRWTIAGRLSLGSGAWLALQVAAAAQTPTTMVVQPLPAQAVNAAAGPRGMVQYLTDGSNATVTLPVKPGNVAGYSRQSGFQLTVDANWPGQYGYRPVEFTLRSQKPIAADQELTIEFSAGDWYAPRAKAMNVERRFTFPAGATTASTRILVPRYQDWQLASWRVKVNGRSDDWLAVDQLYLSQISVGPIGLGAMGLGLSAKQQGDATSVLQASANGLGVNLLMMDGKPLPTDWREYSALDVFLMPVDRLPKLAAESPTELAALLRWVRTGGNLWLLEAVNWSQLAEADQALRGEKPSPEEDKDDAPGDRQRHKDRVLANGWRFAEIGERASDPAEGALALSGFDAGEKPSWQDLVAGVLPNAAIARERILVRGCGLGAVAAFRVELTQQALTSNADGYLATAQSALGSRLTWAARHGNQPDTANDEFNNLLIPDVGVAPVGQFQALITLFVLAIGPLNYWLLKRKKKLPLLLATAPAAALATTIVLFGYGLVVDGFGVQARARTLTLLDQRTEEAVSWGRLSYYAGIAPRSGLSVPADQLMYPIMPRWMMTRYGRMGAGPRYLAWEQDQQLQRGWLASRTPTQYQAISAQSSKKRLELRAADDGLTVVNHLGVDVTHLAVEDHEGRFYWCENLADGARTVATNMERDKLAGNVRRLFTENLPVSPTGEDMRGYFGQFMSQGLMEARLGAINSPMVRSWGPGKYIAFTKNAVELKLGLDNLDEESSFHVIEGTW